MQHNYDLCFKTPQKRWIFVPSDNCRLKGKEIVKTILKYWAPPDYCYHFKAGGHIAAILDHKDNRYFAKVDIKNFFSSILRSRVLRVLRSFHLSYKHRLNIVEWSCVVSKEDPSKRILPFGFVQSQILSTLCMDKSPIGNFLRKGVLPNVAISVYVDDFIISSNDEASLSKTYENLVAAIEKAGLLLNQNKSHPLQLKSSAFNISITQYKRAIEHDRFNKFLNAVSLENPKRSEAIIGYVKSVCPQQGKVVRP